MNNETIAKKRSKNKENIIYTLMGKPLSTENTQKMRVSRCIFYAKDTIGFSIAINPAFPETCNDEIAIIVEI